MQGQKSWFRSLPGSPIHFTGSVRFLSIHQFSGTAWLTALGKSILAKLQNHQDSFEHLAQTYSMGGESVTKGDLGWVARGSIIPRH
ncbi:MAG: peptidylprolyl isomerase [Puia sp.]